MTIELKKKREGVWEIDNGITVQRLVVSQEDMAELYRLLGKALYEDIGVALGVTHISELIFQPPTESYSEYMARQGKF